MELLILPKEIVGEIISHVSVSDLPSLHLTSKGISALTYEYFDREILDPDMEKSERLKYKRMRDTWTHTLCLNLNCTNESKRKLLCEDHFKDVDALRNIHVGIVRMENGFEFEVYEIEVYTSDSKLIFCTVRGNYIQCIGSVGRHEHKVQRMVSDGIEDMKELKGHKYDLLKETNDLTYRTCTHYDIISKEPLIIRKCGSSPNGICLFLLNPHYCLEHNEHPKEQPGKELIEKAIIVTHEYGALYSIIEGELKGHKLNIQNGTIFSPSEQVYEKYGIELK